VNEAPAQSEHFLDEWRSERRHYLKQERSSRCNMHSLGAL